MDRAVANQPRAGGKLPTIFTWNDCKFTFVKDKAGNPSGIEVTCRRPNHKEKTRCTRTLSYAVYGGEEHTLHLLKWWCVKGCKKSCSTRKEHMGLPKEGPPTLPSLAVLEEFEVSAVAAKFAAKSRTSLPRSRIFA